MNTTTDRPVESVGDWDLRGPNFETLLVSQLTGTIGDAARLVMRGSKRDAPWSNGFPNFAMYRAFFAGDTHGLLALHDWLASWGATFARDKLRSLVNRTVAGSYAGQDVFFYLLEQEWAHSPEAVAQEAGVAISTYRRFRDQALERAQASLREYWIRLQMAMLQVRIMENQEPPPLPPVRLSDGRGFDDVDFVGDGNFRAMPRGSGC